MLADNEQPAILRKLDELADHTHDLNDVDVRFFTNDICDPLALTITAGYAKGATFVHESVLAHDAPDRTPPGFSRESLRELLYDLGLRGIVESRGRKAFETFCARWGIA